MRARFGAALAAAFTAGAVSVAACGAAVADRSAGTSAGLATAVAATSAVAAPATAAASLGADVAAKAGVAGVKAAPRKTLRPGAKGASVKELQSRLRALGYVPGKIDGRYGGTTQAAVWAFQKIQGFKPTGVVGAKVWRALDAPKSPKVLVPKGKATRVEVNLTNQTVVLYKDGAIRLISHISSGSGIPYRETRVWQGKSMTFSGGARTPTGNYKTTWRRSGWHISYLGQLYNPIFFNGGIAFHGALSVPLYPASHGCVRLPMAVAGVLPGQLGTGVPVHVRGAFRR